MPGIKVKILVQEGDRSMVESMYQGDLHRCSIPSEEIRNGEADIDALEAGIQYGVNWEELYPGLPNLNWEMHRRGIWVPSDARADIPMLRKAIIAASNNIVKSIIEGGF